MQDYRLYFLDAKGHIHNVVLLECDDDEAAVAAAARHRDGRKMELWRRDRLVQRFGAATPA